MKLSRREFTRSLGFGISSMTCLALSGCGKRTGISENGNSASAAFPKIGFDGFFVGQRGVDDAQALIETAIENGFHFFDNATTYIEGRSERRYGFYLTPKYRDQIFLQSRTKSRTKSVAQVDIDLTLARHQTDYLDSYLMNSVVPYHRDHQVEMPDEDVFEALIEAKKGGKTKRIGIRTREDTTALQALLKTYESEVDCVMVPNSLSPSDKAIVHCKKHGITVIGAVDREAQPNWLKSGPDAALPQAHLDSWVLSLRTPQEVASFASKAKGLKGGIS
ncbi:aldo/keto reductase [Pelagicoccus mobilis]|uniref:Aldo/keto reductase n=1 Tax=Pelagicoccus mobilis TaxID=415221 RepID=A0A934VNQ9_9BACT|nr:aldo/keto reductase [Pelagicoccus mobilis]MBK1876487.1 aldo/keto reductase [Pelagicoccus mobilis]